MRALWTVTVVAALVTAGCGQSATDPGRTPSPDPAPLVGRADPEIVADAISGALTLPGAEVGRAMRLNAFLLGKGIEECGGTAPPLEMTSDRFAQDLFPDLALIADRGFSESVDERDRALETLGAECEDIEPDLRAYRDWRDLRYDWTVLAESIQASSATLAATKPGAAACLRRGAGLEVEDADPTSYLRSVNIALSEDGTGEVEAEQYARVYAECMGEYFDTFAAELGPHRPDLIERHREVLEQFALALSAAGYVP